MPDRAFFLNHAKSGGRFALGLDRETGGGLDGGACFHEDGGAAIVRGWGAGGHHDIADAIEALRGEGDSASCSGVLRAMVRPAFQGFANGAELAFRVGVAVADAGLKDSCGQGIAGVELGELSSTGCRRRCSGRRISAEAGMRFRRGPRAH